MFTLDYTTVEQDRVLDIVRKALEPTHLEMLDDLLLELDQKMQEMDIKIDELLRCKANLKDDLYKSAKVMEALRNDIVCLEALLEEGEDNV